MFRFVETFHHFFAFCLSVFWILLVKHQELAKLISGKNKNNDEFNYSSFPLHRKRTDWLKFELFKKWTKFNYNFSCSGLENIDFNENYIFTPNHESHFDSMWMMAFFPKKMQECAVWRQIIYLGNQFINMG